MINAVLAIVAAIIGIVGGILERRYAKDATFKRDEAKRDKALANRDVKDINNRLMDLHSHVRRQNRNRARQQGADSASDER